MVKARVQSRVAIALFLIFLSQNAWGQLTRAAPAASQPAKVFPTAQDPLGRTTPRGTVLGFLSASYRQDYDTAVQFLDTRATGDNAKILAKELFFVLDRRLPAKLNNVSNDPLGSLNDLVDSRRELIGSVATDGGSRVDIYLERVDRKDAPPIWLFSKQTLVDIPDVYDEIHSSAAEYVLPAFLLRRYFGITLFGWTYFLVFLPVLYLALSLLNRLVGAGIQYAIQHWAHKKIEGKVTILPHPIRILVLSCTTFVTLHRISFSLFARQVGSTVAVLLLIAASVWGMFLVNGRCELYFKRRLESRGRLSATAVLHPARRVMDLVAIFAGLIWLLHSLGINPTATLAGLGVGGIAIALAAQKTLENVIGGASLIMDDAVRVGDTFKIGDVIGTVEVVGLRSTRVRTLDRTLVTIPNGQMATMTLENLTARDQFWFRHLIGVEYGTSPAAMNFILAGIQGLLELDSRVAPSTARVRFLRFAQSSLDIEVLAYVNAREWSHFLEIQEDLLMKIRQLIASAGVEFAFPSQTMYVRNNVEIDGAVQERARRGSDAEKESSHEMQTQ